MVEQVDPFEDGVLDSLQAAPRCAPVNHLSLVEAVDRFGQGVVIRVADRANRRLDPGLVREASESGHLGENQPLS